MKKVIFLFILCIVFETAAQEAIPNKVAMCDTLKEMIRKDTKYRSGDILGDKRFGQKSSYSQKEIDSVWVLQRTLDRFNTKKLLQLTQKYGWLSDERVNCPELNIWLVFRHAPKAYYKEILLLIEHENKAKRLNDFQYKLIKDHVTGKY